MKKLKFSPSKSDIWMNCHGALALCATLPEQESTYVANEGTAAHELAAMCLKDRVDASEWIGEPIEVGDTIFTVNEEMADAVQLYVDTIWADMDTDGVDRSELKVEIKFKLEIKLTNPIKGVGMPVVSGICDAVYNSYFGGLRAYDLKYGVGTYVEVEENSQLLLYILGAVIELDHQGTSEIVIVQPRYRGHEVPPVRRSELGTEHLKRFHADVIDAVSFSYTKNAPLKAGKHCKWCPALGVCEGAREKIFEVVPAENTATLPDPSNMTPENISKTLVMADFIADWIKAVRAYAETQARDLGVVIPGFKLIQKYGNRAWIDELAVENEFEHEFGDAIYDKKLKSPAKLEKAVGKDRVKELVEKPDNGIHLVPESANGEAVKTSANQVFDIIE